MKTRMVTEQDFDGVVDMLANELSLCHGSSRLGLRGYAIGFDTTVECPFNALTVRPKNNFPAQHHILDVNLSAYSGVGAPIPDFVAVATEVVEKMNYRLTIG